MRAFNTAIVSALLVAMSHMARSQDCDFVDDHACCYTENDDSSSNIAYCCNGSIKGSFGTGSDASALNDLICCQDDGITNIFIGYSRTSCVAGSATPLTAVGTAATTIVDAIKSISASKSASRESMFSSISVSTRTSAAVAGTGNTAASTATSSSTASIVVTGFSSSSVSRSASASSVEDAAVGSASASGSTAATTSSSGTAAAVSSSPTSTGGVAMMTMDAWNAVMAGGALFIAAAL